PRRDVPVLPQSSRLARRKPVVTRVEQTGRSVRAAGAADAGAEVVDREVRDRAVLPHRSEVRIPTETQVERHLVANAPGILPVDTEVPLVACVDGGRALTHV